LARLGIDMHENRRIDDSKIQQRSQQSLQMQEIGVRIYKKSNSHTETRHATQSRSKISANLAN
jgi:hypothetical protein